MKKFILTLIILLASSLYVYANTPGYLGFAYSKEIEDNNYINNYSAGYELLYFHDSSDGYYGFSCFGLDYKWGDNGKGVSMHYVFSPPYIYDSNILGLAVGAGPNVLYNFDKKTYGISPQADLSFFIVAIFKLNVTYRYNIYNKAEVNNSHEIEFRLSLLDYTFGLLF